MPTTIHIRPDDLSGDATRRLIALHLAGMHDTSPPESVHALDLDALGDESVSFWSAWVDGELAGIGRRFFDRPCLLVSPRVVPTHKTSVFRVDGSADGGSLLKPARAGKTFLAASENVPTRRLP